MTRDAQPICKDKQRAPSPGLRDEVLARDKYRCVRCGKAANDSDEIRLEVDHIYPHAKGGATVSCNLVTLCRVCNNGKRDKLPDPDFVELLKEAGHPYNEVSARGTKPRIKYRRPATKPVCSPAHEYIHEAILAHFADNDLATSFWACGYARGVYMGGYEEDDGGNRTSYPGPIEVIHEYKNLLVRMESRIDAYCAETDKFFRAERPCSWHDIVIAWVNRIEDWSGHPAKIAQQLYEATQYLQPMDATMCTGFFPGIFTECGIWDILVVQVEEMKRDIAEFGCLSLDFYERHSDPFVSMPVEAMKTIYPQALSREGMRAK